MALESKGVAITSIGIISPLGLGLKENLEGLLNQKTGINSNCVVGSKTLHFGRVNLQIKPPQDKGLASQFKFLNRGGQLAFVVACETMNEQNISLIPPEDRAFFLATGDLTNAGEFMYSTFKVVLDQRAKDIDQRKLNKTAINKVNPFFLLESIANNPFSLISAYFELMGENTTVASLSPCGGLALELAARTIRQGRAKIALVIASGSWINPVKLFEMDGLGLLSTCKRGIYSYAPFDKKRDGFLPSEGAAALLIEDEESARQRGARIYGRVWVCKSMCDVTSDTVMTVPRAMTKKVIAHAIREAGLELDQLAFICAHGSGSVKGDRSELKSLEELFDETKTALPVCALKPYTGHMGAASDLADMILSMESLRRGLIPKTLNFTKSDREFEDIPITREAIKTDKRFFMSVSNGLGNLSVATIVEVI